jgi:hypothetical protein
MKLRPRCAREKKPHFTLRRKMVELHRQGVDALKKRKYPPLQGIESRYLGRRSERMQRRGPELVWVSSKGQVVKSVYK